MDSSGKGKSSVCSINDEKVFFDSGSKEEVQQHFRVPVCPSSHSPKDSKLEGVSGFSPTWDLTEIPTRVMLFELKGGQLGIDLKWMSVHECLCMNALYTNYTFLTTYLLPSEAVLFFLYTPILTSTAEQGSLLRRERDTPGSISAILKPLKYRRTESQALTWEEALNKDCSLNWGYSNGSCMLPKETNPWGFIHLGINQALGRGIFTRLLPSIMFPDLILPDQQVKKF